MGRLFESNFASASAGQSTTSIASHPVNDTNPSIFEKSLTSSMHTETLRGGSWMYQPCKMHRRSVQAWLEGMLSDTGKSTALGTVPVKVYSLVFSPKCLSVSSDKSAVRAEFVAHRHGDPFGTHYSVQMSSSIPYVMYEVVQRGFVSQDRLWSVHNETGKSF